MLAHRLRRWPNMDPTLDQRLVFAECASNTTCAIEPLRNELTLVTMETKSFFFKFEIIINVLVSSFRFI